MSVADPFCAGLRHGSYTSPGSNNAITFGDTAPPAAANFNPNPATNPSLFVVDLDEEKSRLFLERIWNMEDWKAHVFSEMNIGGMTYSILVDGKFSAVIADIDDYSHYDKWLRGVVYKAKPDERVAGEGFSTQSLTNFEYIGDDPLLTYGPFYPGASLAPRVEIEYRPATWGSTGITVDREVDIKDEEDGNKVGDARVRYTVLTDNPLWPVYITAQVARLWLKPDGTVRLYIDLFVSADTSETLIFLANEDYPTFPDFYGHGSAYTSSHEVTIHLFGVEVTANLWLGSSYVGGESWPVNLFSFEYRVDGVTLYTYPVG